MIKKLSFEIHNSIKRCIYINITLMYHVYHIWDSSYHYKPSGHKDQATEMKINEILYVMSY